MQYILGIDQSTQGTKAVLVDEEGRLAGRADRKHRQLVNDLGWVSHDPEEIYQNTLLAVKDVLERSRTAKEDVLAIGISNQRETTVLWGRNGKPMGNAVVWQCSRAGEIVKRLQGQAERVREKTGLPLSPYFPAAKMAWLLENQLPPAARKGKHSAGRPDFLLGTMDSWLIYLLTEGEAFKTDYSNASRTQLFNLHTLTWDEELCELFGIPRSALPEVCDSDHVFGATTLEGYFPKPVPILGAMGDSHAALFAQGCHRAGMIKATYGTGSSVMMNIGPAFRKSVCGLATSLAWGIDGRVEYVLEGNVNYTGAVITWLKEDVGLLSSLEELEPLLERASSEDRTILVPAFSGLSAPYWDDQARAVFCGMGRTTGRAELMKAAVESIAYQITDVIKSMERDSGIPVWELNVDGGPTRNTYLMQFQSDMAGVAVRVPEAEEFSALGAAYMAGLKAGLYQEEGLFRRQARKDYEPQMTERVRREKYQRWQQAVEMSRIKL